MRQKPKQIDELLHTLEHEIEAFERLGHPPFATDAMRSAMASKQVIVCGLDPDQTMLLLYLLLRERFQIIGIADDNRAGEKVLRQRVMSSTELAAATLPDDVLFISSCSHDRKAYVTFKKIAADRGQPWVNTQQFAYLARLAGMPVEMTLDPDFFVTSIKKDWQRYVNLLPSFDDELSRQNLLQIVLGRLTVDFDWFWESYSPVEDMYFPAFFSYCPDEILIDAGAYDGRDTLRFLKRRNYEFDTVYLFELDSLNIPKIEATFQTIENPHTRSRLHLVPEGLWSEKAELEISAEGTSTFISNVQDEDHRAKIRDKSRVTDLDSAVDVATLIKLEIEGAEIPALHGARRIITQQKPNLSISAYHLTNDIPNIVQFTRDIDLGYRLRLRHHWGSDVRTLIYAATEFTA